MPSTRRTLAAAALAAVALIAGAALAVLQRGATPAPLSATVYNTPRPLPAFDLLDQDGRPVSRQALIGGWHWLFFGFTHCPDVCPTTLATLARARALIEDAADKPGVMLVSVDPQRDTPQVLGRYVTHFDPEFRALTGAPAQIDALAEAMYVAHAKIPQGEGYTIDHFSGVFFVDDQARVVAVTSAPHDAATIAGDYLAVREARP